MFFVYKVGLVATALSVTEEAILEVRRSNDGDEEEGSEEKGSEEEGSEEEGSEERRRYEAEGSEEKDSEEKGSEEEEKIAVIAPDRHAAGNKQGERKRFRCCHSVPDSQVGADK